MVSDKIISAAAKPATNDLFLIDIYAVYVMLICINAKKLEKNELII